MKRYPQHSKQTKVEFDCCYSYHSRRDARFILVMSCWLPSEKEACMAKVCISRAYSTWRHAWMPVAIYIFSTRGHNILLSTASISINAGCFYRLFVRLTFAVGIGRIPIRLHQMLRAHVRNRTHPLPYQRGAPSVGTKPVDALFEFCGLFTATCVPAVILDTHADDRVDVSMQMFQDEDCGSYGSGSLSAFCGDIGRLSSIRDTSQTLWWRENESPWSLFQALLTYDSLAIGMAGIVV